MRPHTFLELVLWFFLLLDPRIHMIIFLFMSFWWMIVLVDRLIKWMDRELCNVASYPRYNATLKLGSR